MTKVKSEMEKKEKKGRKTGASDERQGNNRTISKQKQKQKGGLIRRNEIENRN